MKYVDQKISVRDVEHPGNVREEVVRVPQFGSFNELAKEFSKKEIAEIVNATLKITLSNKARTKLREGLSAQRAIWFAEATGLHDVMFPLARRKLPTITVGEVEGVKDMEELIKLLKEKGMEIWNTSH